LELCGIAAARGVPGSILHASGVGPAAAPCARTNVAGQGGSVSQGDVIDALPATLRESFDILLVNAPYLPSGEMRLLPTEATVHENRLAVDR
jgi:release factor glutamine methyltransferase